MNDRPSSLVGRTLSHYEIVEEIGRGGMGVVYRARDTELRRDVALKVLPEDFVADKDRLARFEREARVLAALNHPGIATIHELGREGSTHFLVMELVPGDDLTVRLSRGGLSLEEVMKLFPQIAEALEAAHGQGVVHRDLKPANVKVTPEGRVKLLDFGLAKPVEASAEQDPSLSPTLTREGTATGVILGTASYMSPEQALGKTVDKRADVWAFGCVLYEALSGRKAFPGQTVVETLAAVLRKEPDWNALPSDAPPALRTLVKRCLRVDPDRRLHDIADARIDIEEATSVPEASSAPPRRQRTTWLVPLASALVAALVAAAFLPAKDAPPVMRLAIVPPDGTELPQLGAPEISPNAKEVAFTARDASGTSHLWVRPLESFDARRVEGTDGAEFPFWSPDGERIGFFAQGKLLSVNRGGGNVQSLADVEFPREGTWNQEGTILFAPGRSTGLARVSSQGGPVTSVTSVEFGDSHRYPQFLPDGQHFLYRCTCGEESGVFVGSLDGGEPRFIKRSGRARFVPPGYLLFVEDGWLVAQRFDPDDLSLEGEPVPLREDVDPDSDSSWYSVSGDIIAYARDDLFAPERRLVWYDRNGREIGTIGDPGVYASPELSPDETRVAFGWSDPASSEAADIWVHDLREGTSQRLEARNDHDRAAIWSPAGSEIVFQASDDGRGLRRKSLDSPGPSELLLPSNTVPIATSWTRGFLVYMVPEPTTQSFDIWALPLSPGAGQAFPIVATENADGHGRVSPDGQWMAFNSNVDPSSGGQVYVQRFPEDNRRHPVSMSGGVQPRWRGDGRELFFVAPNGAIMAVDVELGREPRFGEPRELFRPRIDPELFTAMRNFYDVTSDGQRFIVVERAGETQSREFHVVVNWRSLLSE